MGELTARLRPFFVYAGLLSLAINLLLLAPPLYMLQVFDRVISSRSEETLIALTLATVAAIGLMAFLDAIRARLLAAAGIALDRRLGPRVLDGLLSRLSGADFVHGLRDVNTLRGFLTGNGVLALKQRSTPLVQGRVTYVSGDRLVESQTGVPYYVMHVDVPPDALGDLRLQAGMPAEVFVRTDERSTFDYLLAPVTSYFRRAMREPL